MKYVWQKAVVPIEAPRISKPSREGLAPQLVGDQAERIPDFGFACVQKHAFQRAFGVDEAEGLNDVPLATGNNAVVEVPRVSHEVRASVSDFLKEGMDRETKEKRA